MSGEPDILQAAVRIELHSEMNLVAAHRVIAMNQHSSVAELSKISWPPRMIEDDRLVKLLQLRVHEKKRTASLRISIIRSISSFVL